MAILNRRNAVLGWAVWSATKWAAKQKARTAVPGPGDYAGLNKGALASILGVVADSCCSGASVGRRQRPRVAWATPAGLLRPALADLVPYEPGKPVEEVQRELGLERVVKLASNEGPFGPFPAALEALERAAARAEPLPGRRRLPRSARRSPSGTASRFEEVALGAGADGARSTASRRPSLDPGDEIVCGWPSFPSYVIDARKLGAMPRARAAARPPLRPRRAARRDRRRARSSSTSATRTTRPAR